MRRVDQGVPDGGDAGAPPAREPVLSPVGRRGESRRIGTVACLLLGLIVLAVAKPWAGAPRPDPGLEARSAPTPAATRILAHVAGTPGPTLSSASPTTLAAGLGGFAEHLAINCVGHVAPGSGRPGPAASADPSLGELVCALSGPTGILQVWSVGDSVHLPDYGLR